MGDRKMNKISFVREKNGTVSILVAVSMVALLSMAALAIDLSNLYLAKGDLQNAADAAALAGASGLGIGQSEARDRAGEYARLNAGVDFELGEDDIVLGVWDFSNRSFDSKGAPANAIRVTARRTGTGGSSNQEVPLLFARLFGEESNPVAAQATAAVLSRDVMLVLDRSQSMAALSNSEDIDILNGPKIRGTKDGAILFIETLRNSQLTEDKVGIAWYDFELTVTQPLTDDLDNLDLETIVNDVEAIELGTSISAGLNYAIKELNRAESSNQKVIVLLTDGKANTCIPLGAKPGWLGPPEEKYSIMYPNLDHGDPFCCLPNPGHWYWDPKDILDNSRAKLEVMYLASEEAAPKKIIIYTITIGFKPHADPGLLQSVSEVTNGKHFSLVAEQGEDLEDIADKIPGIFGDIADRLPVCLVE